MIAVGILISRYRYLVGVLSLGFSALLWVGLAQAPAPGMIFGIYPMRVFALLIAVSYVALWAAYASFGNERLSDAIGTFLLTTISLGIIIVLLELPALIGILDYRRFASLPESTLFTRLKPWENPGNRLDRELLHVHRPGQEIRGETVGDLVRWLQVPTDRRHSIDVKYDSRGFRNEHEIEHAPVIVLGDSFAEAGLVSNADLASNRLARRLDLEVANFGQSGYGPQQELVVLRRYGLDLQPRLVLWLFFEGNDLLDLPRYERLRKRWDEEIRLQNSPRQRLLVRNVLRLIVGLTEPAAPLDEMKARRRSCMIRDPLTDEWDPLYFAYVGKPLTEEDRTSLQKTQEILLEADRLCNDNDARLVLVYVPTKFRVYDEACDYPEESEMRAWRVNDLPQQMESWAAEHGLSFIDLTGPLKEAAARGELVFFQDDGHWNARGNEIATEAIIEHIDRTGIRATLR